MTRNFWTLLEARHDKGLLLCVGLDTDYDKLPPEFQDQTRPELVGWMTFCFNKAIIEATQDLVCAYKLNKAFYEAQGRLGIYALERTIEYIKRTAPDVPIILDAKYGDVKNTNIAHAHTAFRVYGVDAVTVNPYVGHKALEPFLEQKEKGIFVLCHTSNEDAEEFQELKIGRRPLYQVVAKRVAKYWNTNNNCGLVVGATAPEQLAAVRTIAGDMTILTPGIGAQAGDLASAIRAGVNSRGRGIVVNASRSILYASTDEGFAEAAQREIKKLNRYITALL